MSNLIFKSIVFITDIILYKAQGRASIKITQDEILSFFSIPFLVKKRTVSTKHKIHVQDCLVGGEV